MMNKTNYKTIAVVAVNNVSIAMSATENNQYKHMKKLGQNNLVASLKVLKSVLSGIDNNDCITNEPRLIIVGSKSPIKGFATGTFVEYLRTGANASGKAFTEEEMTLIRECTELFANKCFNVRITTDEFVSYKDKATKTLIDSAWKQVKAIAQQLMNQTKPAVQQVVSEKQKQDNQVAETIAKLSAEVTNAVLAGDMAKATQISEIIKNLQTTSAELDKVVEEMEVPEDVQQVEDENDPLAGADEMEM